MLYLIDGIGFGIWAAFLPTIQHRLAMTNAETSRPLMGMVLGALVAMPVMGQFISRFGSARCLRWAAPAYVAALPFLILAPSLLAVTLLAVLFGALKGALDVTVNSQGVVVERYLGRPTMGLFQSLWSVGGLVSALGVSALLKTGWNTTSFLVGVSLTLILICVAVPRFLLREASASATTTAAKDSERSGILWRVGALAFFALFSEGVLMDWSAIYTRNVVGASASLAPLAFGVFSSMMALGRFLGDGIRARLGAEQVLRWSGAFTVAGLVLSVGYVSIPTLFLGLALAGLGLSNLVPIFLAAASQGSDASVGRAVSLVSTIGYFGFIVGPPLIGGLSELLTLRGSLLIVVGFGALIGLWGPLIVRRALAGAGVSDRQ